MNTIDMDFLNSIPLAYQKNYEKAMSGKSDRAAVKAKCLDCTGYQKNEIAKCPSTTCPLHPRRPYQKVRKYEKTLISDGI